MGVSKPIPRLFIGTAIAVATLAIADFSVILNGDRRHSSHPSAAISAESTLFHPPLPIAELTTLAKDVTVFISGGSSGSGAIVDRQGNTYTILTSKQVVSSGGTYEVVTADGTRHRVSGDGVKRLPLVDLAVLQFTSARTYRVAEFAESSTSQIYLAVATQPQTTLFGEGVLVSAAGITLAEGYELVYNSALQPSMGGGPVFDPWGRAIAIQGRFNAQSPTVNSAIPIATFLRLAPTVGLNLGWRGLILGNAIPTPTEPSAIALSEDNALLATDAGYNAIQLWEWRSGQLLYTLSGHNSQVTSLAIGPDKQVLVSGDEDGKAIVWNLLNGQIKYIIDRSRRDAANPIESVAIAPNGQIFATASARGVELWDLQTGELTIALPGSADATAIAFTPDSRTLASGHFDNTVKLWNLLNGNLLHTLEAGERGFVVEAIAISPDGKTVAGGTYRQFRLWDIDRGIRKRTIEAHGEFSYVYDLAFTPDGTAIASTSEDGTKLWDLATGNLLRTIDSSAKTLAITRDRTLILGDDRIEVWQLPSESLRSGKE